MTNTPLTQYVDTSLLALPQTNQGQEPACEAFEVAKYIQLLVYKQTGKIYNFSQRWIYSNCVRPGVTGLFALDVLEFGRKVGFVTDGFLDESVIIPEAQYREIVVTPQMVACASCFKISGYVGINPDPASIRQAIIYYSAVMCSIPVGNFTQSPVQPPPPGAGLGEGLHAALIYGIAPAYQGDYWMMWDNWWSIYWGQNGYGTFLWSLFANVIQQIYSITSLTIKSMPDTYSKSFTDSVNNTLGYEGGLTNDPNDPGGTTNFGISQKSYPNLNIPNLTREMAIGIYYSDYWTPIFGDLMPECLAMNVFDCAVNCGLKPAILMMQEVIGVVTDGVIGPKTKAAMAKATPDMAKAYEAKREYYYEHLVQFPIYGQTWLARAKGTLATSLAS